MSFYLSRAEMEIIPLFYYVCFPSIHILQKTWGDPVCEAKLLH